MTEPEQWTLTIPGRPPAKNDRDRACVINGKPARRLTARFRSFVAACELEKLAVMGAYSITDGHWHAEILAYQPEKSIRHGGIANPDVDAPVSCIFDALQRAGVIDDDIRFLTFTAAKAHDKDDPRCVVRLERLR